jgi:hypothetical protein
MAIDQKQKTEADKTKPLVFRDNPEVKKRIDAHKKANPEDVVYYTRLVREHPERAIETFLYKDMQKHESEMRLIAKQLPQAKAFYDAQEPAAKARIDRELEGVQPYYKDKVFVTAVLRESDRQTRRQFTNPGEKTSGVRMVA